MKLTKHNNPNKRRSVRRLHSEAYMNEMRKQRDDLLAKCQTAAEREMILKAYDVTVNIF